MFEKRELSAERLEAWPGIVSFEGRREFVYPVEVVERIILLFDQDTATQIATGGNTYAHYREDLCSVAGCDRANSSDWFFSNVPNMNIREVMADSDVDPFFLQPVAWQAPRTVRLGVKYNF